MNLGPVEETAGPLRRTAGMHRLVILSGTVLFALGAACSDDTADPRDDPTRGGSAGARAGDSGANAGAPGADAGAPGGSAGAAGAAGGGAEQTGADAPAERAALELFLAEGAYAGWPAEVSVHASPIHGKGVRVFYGPLAAAAVRARAPTFPAGAATVKELWDKGRVHGYSVWVKTAAESQDGGAFYWYEAIDDGKVLYEGTGISVCVSCHSSGQDFLRSELPFE